MEQVQFAGSIPAAYDRYLRPLLFDPYARWVVEHMQLKPGDRVLELAAGTGALTAHLVRTAPPGVEIVATDLQPPMIEIGKKNVSDPGVQWEIADAQELPFANGAFDWIVIQFGYMFFPDKDLAAKEARRVLKPGGKYASVVWNAVERNPVAQISKRVIGENLPDGVPKAFDVPFGFGNRPAIQAVLGGAGFKEVRFEDVELISQTTAQNAAAGFCRGTPMAAEIAERVPERHDAIHSAVENALTKELGAEFTAELSALYIEATA